MLTYIGLYESEKGTRKKLIYHELHEKTRNIKPSFSRLKRSLSQIIEGILVEKVVQKRMEN